MWLDERGPHRMDVEYDQVMDLRLSPDETRLMLVNDRNPKPSGSTISSGERSPPFRTHVSARLLGVPMVVKLRSRAGRRIDGTYS
jgi:hypothetical protein